LTPAPAGNLLEYLQQIPDPRGRQGRRHSSAAMLAAVAVAILCGQRGYAGIADWLRLQPPQVWHRLGFWRKPPTRNAFRKLLMRILPEAMEQALRLWAAALLGEPLPEDPLQPVAMDGKSLCGTLQQHARAVHLLSLLDQHTGCVLSQLAVDSKTNEAKTALEILDTIALRGRVITADAMFCQRDVCEKIVDSGGHYFVVVKDNQPTLRANIAAEFQPAFSPLHREAAPRIAG
jgi:hypothetical protein